MVYVCYAAFCVFFGYMTPTNRRANDDDAEEEKNEKEKQTTKNKSKQGSFDNWNNYAQMCTNKM